MSGLFSSPRMPQATPISYTPSIPPAPVIKEEPPTEEKDIEKVEEEEKKKIKKGRTGKGTILTGPRGILTPAEVERKTLLGE